MICVRIPGWAIYRYKRMRECPQPFGVPKHSISVLNSYSKWNSLSSRLFSPALVAASPLIPVGPFCNYGFMCTSKPIKCQPGLVWKLGASLLGGHLLICGFMMSASRCVGWLPYVLRLFPTFIAVSWTSQMHWYLRLGKTNVGSWLGIYWTSSVGWSLANLSTIRNVTVPKLWRWMPYMLHMYSLIYGLVTSTRCATGTHGRRYPEQCYEEVIRAMLLVRLTLIDMNMIYVVARRFWFIIALNSLYLNFCTSYSAYIHCACSCSFLSIWFRYPLESRINYVNLSLYPQVIYYP